MRVIVAETAGFCSGAQKAFNILDSIEAPNKCVFWGELLHSKEVQKAIEAKGGKLIDPKEKNLERIKGKIVYLPAHGVEKEIEKKIRGLAEKVIDNTCMSILQIHKTVEEMEADGRQVVIVGLKNHAETKGILSYTKHGIVVESPEELLKLIEDRRIPINAIGVVVQTTAELNTFLGCLQVLNEKCTDTQIFNTLCDSVSANQERTRELARSVDVMIILGGKNSANTKALNEISSEYTRTYWVEELSEIRETWFEDAKVVGLTAGASTPKKIIVEARLLIESFQFNYIPSP
jgi:4-hydroxy-3-methylbut-2-en-1-yl diphosphate reductase